MTKRIVAGLFALSLLAGRVSAQTASPVTEFQLRASYPYSQAVADIPGLTLADYNTVIRSMAASLPTAVAQPRAVASTPVPAGTSQTYLGRLSANPYAPNSTSNPYSPSSVNNPYGPYGNPYGPNSATNPYATQTPKLVGADGKYLGKLSSNPYDPDSISNPYGRYGSPYSPTSITNPYGVYGSPYSPLSPTNPYATSAPLIIAPLPTLPPLAPLPVLLPIRH